MIDSSCNSKAVAAFVILHAKVFNFFLSYGEKIGTFSFLWMCFTVVPLDTF